MFFFKSKPDATKQGY